LALGVSAYSLVVAQLAAFRSKVEAENLLDKGRHSAEEGRLELAVSQFAAAAELVAGDRRLRGLLAEIRDPDRPARPTEEVRDAADKLFEVGEHLRFSWLGFSGEPKAACRRVESALARFSVPDDRDWIRKPSIELLDEPRRSRLVNEVNELLFLWVFALD